MQDQPLKRQKISDHEEFKKDQIPPPTDIRKPVIPDFKPLRDQPLVNYAKEQEKFHQEGWNAVLSGSSR